MPLRYTKYFATHRDATANYRDATLWLYARGFKSGCIDIMQNDDVILVLEGEDAKRALDEDYPIEPGGFRLGDAA